MAAPLTALPGLLFAVASLWLGGRALALRGLKAGTSIEAAALALPLGLLAFTLSANALAYVCGPRAAFWITLAALLGAGLGDWVLRARSEPIAPLVAPPTRVVLALLLVVAGLGTLALGLCEIFPDDGAHASMAQLLVHGHFPLRFPCEPSLRLAYHYGADLLVAGVVTIANVTPWLAIDVIRALTVVGVLQLAFVVGFRLQHSVAAGLLSAVLFATVGQWTWLCQPFVSTRLGDWARGHLALAPFVDWLRAYALSPYGLFAPSTLSEFAQAQRSLAWCFGPLLALLFLIVMELPLSRTRKSVALALVLGATGLLQSGALPTLAGTLALAAGWTAWQRLRRLPGPGFDVALVVALGLLLIAVQGGTFTDSLLDRWDGRGSSAVSLVWAFPQLPGCRGQGLSISCLLRAGLTVGLTPWLVPALVAGLWHSGQRARLWVVGGCLASAAVPLFFSYPYDDGTLARLQCLPLWILAALMGPELTAALKGSSGRRWMGAVALVLLSTSGVVFLAGMVQYAPWRARSPWATPGPLFGIGPLDSALLGFAERLPSKTLGFDPAGCLRGLASRPGVILGIYTASADERLEAPRPSPTFLAVREDPAPERLRAHGYSHLYLDGPYWRTLPEDKRAALLAGPFELLGSAHDASDVRLLLRLCAPGERCAWKLPDPVSRWLTAPPPAP